MTEGELHCHVDNVSRRNDDGTERSAVAAAAYISGTNLWNEYENKLTRFSGKSDVVLAEIFAPEGAPDWTRNRESLWNRVDMQAKRRDARLAKIMDASIPRAIRRQDWPALMRDFVAPYVAMGMVADAALHDDGTHHNPHLHLMLTVNALEPNGFGRKLTAVDHKSFVTQARTGWETVCNTYLAAAGSALRLDKRSYKARGIAKIPTTHRGPNRQERQDRRAYARRLRQEAAMTQDIPARDRREYPLLTGRAEWPFPDNRAPGDLSAAERTEFDRLVGERREAAERAAEAALRETGAAAWLERRFPDPVPVASDVPWYLAPEPGSAAAPTDRDAWHRAPEPDNRDFTAGHGGDWDRTPVETEYFHPSRDDFRVFSDEVAAARLSYEKDLWVRAVNLPRTRQENDLMKRAEQHSPEMRKLMEDRLFEQRLQRLRHQDDDRRMAELESRLGPALREPLEEYTRPPLQQAPYPVPGPYEALTHPNELAREQDRMVAAYEREEEEPDRGR